MMMYGSPFYSLSPSVVIAVALLLLPGGIVGSEEPDAWPRVVVQHYGYEQQDADLERILDRAARDRLRRTELAAASRPVVAEGEESVSLELLLEQSEDLRGELFLFGEYRVSGRRLRLSYRLVDLDRGEVLAAVEREGDIDLLLDRVVARALQEVLEEAAERITELRARRARVAQAAEDESTARVEAEDGDETEDEGEDEAVVGPGTIDDAEPPVKTADGDAPMARMELSAGGSAIIAVGESAQYLPFGYTAGALLLVWLDADMERFGIGFRVDFQRLIPSEEGRAGFVSSFVPLGLEVQVSPWRAGAVSLRVTVTGGAAMRIDDDSAASQRLAAAIPFASGGAEVSLALGGGYGIGAKAALRSLFHLYREDGESDVQVEPIMGVSPGLYVYRKF